MRVLNDFECTHCGVIDEYFLDNTETETLCRECGACATKVQRPIGFSLEGTSGLFPTAADQGVKRREQRMKEEKSRATDNE